MTARRLTGVVLFVLSASAGCSWTTGTKAPDVDRSTSELSAFEREAFADGTITFGEYEAAVLRSVQCLAAAGYEVSGPVLDEAGRIFTYGFRADETADHPLAEAEEFGQSVYDDCFARYEDDIQLAWIRATEPSEAERVQYFDELIECLADEDFEGIDQSPADPDDFLESLDFTTMTAGQLRCLDVYSRLTATAAP